MTEEILHVQLPRTGADGPGSKGVAEAVGVDLSNPSPRAVTSEHNVRVMIAKGPAVYGLEEVACAPAAKVLQVGSEGFKRYFAYRRPALLTSLALKDAHTALLEEHIAKLNRHELA